MLDKAIDREKSAKKHMSFDEDSYKISIDKNLDDKTKNIALSILNSSSKHNFSLLNKSFWSAKMMDLSMNYPKFKIEMFRFVDVLPSLTSKQQILDHVYEYFILTKTDLPQSLKSLIALVCKIPVVNLFFASMVKTNVEIMAKTFIAGENGMQAITPLKKLWDKGFLSTVDILGEAVLSEAEADLYFNKYLELINSLSSQKKNWVKSSIHNLSSSFGEQPVVNVSVKLSSLFSQIDPIDLAGSIAGISKRLLPLLDSAMEKGVFINLDMEDFELKDLTLSLIEEIFLQDKYKNYPHFGIVIQAYLTSAKKDILRVVDLAKKRNTPITVRLVKGAYWDTEVIIAKQNNWHIPVYTQKAASDLSFENLSKIMLDNHKYIISAFGSHNVRSLAHAFAYADEKNIAKQDIEVQMLFGMSDAFKHSIKELGYRVREYVPVGEILPGMAYLVRRLLENTANEGFLKNKFVSGASSDSLLQNPALKVSEVNKNGNI